MKVPQIVHCGEEDAAIQRLKAAVPEIQKILRVFQSPSFSVGVLHKNRTIFTRGFGYSDKNTGHVPNPETIYSLGSCTKAFALALVLLAQRGRIRLKAPVSDYLPAFDTPYNPSVGHNATLADILSHSTGLAPLLYGVMGKNDSILTRHEDVVHISSRLPCCAPLRSKWQYNNWLYALAACLVDKESKGTWSDCVYEIIHGLDLTRTYTYPPVDDNVARAYIVFSDGTSVERALPSLQGGDAFDGSGSLRSCVKDMLIWCKMIIAASNSPASSREEGVEAVPPVLLESTDQLSRHNLLKAIRIIQQPQIPLALDKSQSYCLGLYSFRLPTKEINTVTNAPDVTNSYILGAESAPRAVLGHSGDLGGFTSAYWVFPETESAVVVMTNASSVDGDPSNIVAQALTQALFALTPKVDFVEIAAQATAAAKGQWQRTVHTWKSKRQRGTIPKDLIAYVGSYTSTDLQMTLKVSIATDCSSSKSPELQLCINDLPDQNLSLYHYHLDTWSFLPKSRDQCLAMGLAIYIPSWQTFNFEFDRFAVDSFRGILWTMDLDPRVGPQVFSRIGP